MNSGPGEEGCEDAAVEDEYDNGHEENYQNHHDLCDDCADSAFVLSKVPEALQGIVHVIVLNFR